MDLNTSEHTQGTTYDIDFLETLVYEYIRRSMYFTKFRLSTRMLKAVAFKFNSILNLKLFEPKKEWVVKFRKTYSLRDVETSELDDIGYKVGKSTSPVDIFNELQPQWASLDPKTVGSPTETESPTKLNITSNLESRIVNNSSDEDVIEIKDETNDTMPEQIIPSKTSDKTNHNDPYSSDSVDSVDSLAMFDTNTDLVLDIEDELPVCTIFGRKTVQNVANIISNKNTKDETFEPMIVCTDPKNPNLNTITEKQTFFKSKNEVDKIKDLINGKLLDSDSSSQPEYIDQYLKEIVRAPEDVNSAYTSNQILEMKRIKKIKANKARDPSIELPEAMKTESLDTAAKKPLEKVRRKRKLKQTADDKSAKNMHLETKAVDQTTTIKQPRLVVPPQPPPQVETVTSMQTEIPNQMPLTSIETETSNQIPVLPQQQSWDPTALAMNTTTPNFAGDTISETQPGIMYAFQNPPTMPYISSMTTNLETTVMGQSSTLTPIFLHFHSPMQLQTTGSGISPTIINLQQTPFLSSMDTTQQTLPTINFQNFIQNQLVPTITTQMQQSIFTQTPTIVTTTSTSNPSTPIPEVIASNSNLTTKPTAVHIPLKQKTPILETIASNSKLSIKPTAAHIPSNQMTPILEAIASNSNLIIKPTAAPLNQKTPILETIACNPYLTIKSTAAAHFPSKQKTPILEGIASNSKLTIKPTASLITSKQKTPILETVASNSNLTIKPSAARFLFNQKTPIFEALSSNSNLTIKPTTPIPEPIASNSNPAIKPTAAYIPSNQTSPMLEAIASNSNLVIKSTAAHITSNQKTPILDSLASNSNLTIKPKAVHIPKVKPAKIVKNRTKNIPTKPMPSTISTQQTSIFQAKSSTLNSSLRTHIQPPVSTQTSTITSSPIISTTSPYQSAMFAATSSTSNSTMNTITTTVMQAKPISLHKSKLAKKTEGTRFAQREPLKNKAEALKCIKLMEDFAMINEDFRLIGFLERLQKQVY